MLQEINKKINNVNENGGFYKITYFMPKNVYFPANLLDLANVSNEFEEFYGERFSIVITYENNIEQKTYWYLPQIDVDSIAYDIINRLLNEKEYKKIKKEIISKTKELETFIESIKKQKFNEYSNNDLMNFFKRYINNILKYRVLAFLPNIVSIGKKNIIDIIKERLLHKVSPEEFTKLVTPSKLSQQILSEKELLLMISQNKINDKNIKEWINKWGYIYYYYIGPLPTVAEVKKMITKLKNTYDIKKRIKDIENYSINIEKEKKNIIKSKKINNEEEYLIELVSFLMYYKLQRKEIFQKSYVYMDYFFKEVSNRTNKKIEELKFLNINELENLLLYNKFDPKKIEIRTKELCFISLDNKQKIIEDIKEIKEILNSLKEHKPQTNIMVAYAGKNVKGKLIIINSKKDMEKLKNINEPFILGSYSTFPDLVPAMAKASGIITKIGGMTSHAAIVARELKKPCIVGYNKLFEEFKEGDYILLDTKNGKIEKIK